MINEYILTNDEIHEIQKMIDLYPDDAKTQIIDSWADENINGMISEDCLDDLLNQVEQ